MTMKKNQVSPNQMGIPFAEDLYDPKAAPVPTPKGATRRLKVRPKWEVTATGDIYPEVRFGGKYLQDAGFLIGREVTLTMRRNKLVLSLGPLHADRKNSISSYLENLKIRRQYAAASRKMV
jgi:hypothetical protein